MTISVNKVLHTSFFKPRNDGTDMLGDDNKKNNNADGTDMLGDDNRKNNNADAT